LKTGLAISLEAEEYIWLDINGRVKLSTRSFEFKVEHGFELLTRPIGEMDTVWFKVPEGHNIVAYFEAYHNDTISQAVRHSDHHRGRHFQDRRRK